MQSSAHIVITGLGVEDCAAYIAACNGAGKRWTYSAADELLAAPAQGSDGSLVFWLYRAPWHLPPGGPMADEWLALHRRLLRGRAAFGGRLVLINADDEQPSDVLASLGLAGDGVAPMVSSDSGSAIDAGMSALLAKAFDWAAPEFWDVFEALESAAPPTGRMPLFRSALQAPGADQVLTLQRLVAAGAQAPALASGLQSAQQQLSAAQQLAEQGRTQALELERENELLLLQLHQVQEELEQGFLDHRKQLAQADAAQAEQAGMLASLQAELSQQLEKVGVSAQALSAAQQLADQGRTQVSELESENELLLLQLHQVQEELEQGFLDHRKQLAQADAAQAEQAGLLASLQAELSQQLEKVGVSAQALSAAQQLADQGRTQVSELESENELLLLQLHQVQEELEQYFLDNRQLQQVMGQSRHSLDRARHLISRLMLPAQDASTAQGLALKAS